MLIWALLTLSLSLMVKIGPGETRCFRDQVKKDDRLSINVHVSGETVSPLLSGPRTKGSLSKMR